MRAWNLHKETDFEKNCFYNRPIRVWQPFFLNAKLLLGDLWKMDDEWDKPIKYQYADQWKEINEDLNAIKEKKFKDLLQIRRLNFYAFTMLPARHTEQQFIYDAERIVRRKPILYSTNQGLHHWKKHHYLDSNY